MRIIDVGQEATGVIAIGQIATGVLAIGQLAIGVIAIDQVSRGVVAVGQGAVGVSPSASWRQELSMARGWLGSALSRVVWSRFLYSVNCGSLTSFASNSRARGCGSHDGGYSS